MEKHRILVYADEPLNRRIELAAAKYNVPVTAYCLRAITQQLADDDLLEEAQVSIAIHPNQQTDETLIEDLRALRAAILADRGGQLIDVDDLLEQGREERDDELSGVR
jgi:hypothetical protein